MHASRQALQVDYKKAAEELQREGCTGPVVAKTVERVAQWSNLGEPRSRTQLEHEVAVLCTVVEGSIASHKVAIRATL